jgi:hypothetical protein
MKKEKERLCLKKSELDGWAVYEGPSCMKKALGVGGETSGKA